MSNNQYQHHRLMKVGKSTMMEEVLILAEDARNVYFIRVNELDEVDKARIRSILSKRSANSFPFWDLLDQTTLGNGMNALEYFHQLAYVQNAEGDLSRPGKAFGGTLRRQAPAAPVQAAAAPKTDNVLEAVEAVEKKRPGRPPKANNV